MRFAAAEKNTADSDSKNTTAQENPDSLITLAIGQKAAYFTNTSHFVDIVEGGGMYGYSAIKKLAELMVEAYENAKDTKKVISHKGWGCSSCL